ncbi:cobyrinate a,c-diamide synthase [Thermodesulfobacteriota bacterium]
MLNSIPRVIIAALKGGSGKTIFSLGLTSAWIKMGYKVAPFKKGPDYIDAGWLAFAAGRPCYNLDPFLMSKTQIVHSLLLNSTDADIALIEGNRGLFDGLDLDGCCSTAELGKLTRSPIVIIADVTMATRTIAALIMGCQRFDPALNIAAVILNRVAGTRQETLVRDSIERYCGIRVIGSVPKLKEKFFPERHMGLVPHQEKEHARKAIKWARSVVESNLDLDAVWRLAHAAEPMGMEHGQYEDGIPDFHISDPPRIGFIRDQSFWFYYPENMDQLKGHGATLVEINSITDGGLPDLDALYIGGGFPETRAKALADNKGFRNSLKQMIDKGLPVYAECGGLIYLGEALYVNDETYPMVGALPLQFVMDKKPQGHGYTVLEVIRENLFYPEGEVIKGHEFHYSRPVISRPEEINFVFKVQRGHGLDGKRDGLCKKNLLATYTHIHAGGNSLWGENFMRAALQYQRHEKKPKC